MTYPVYSSKALDALRMLLAPALSCCMVILHKPKVRALTSLCCRIIA